MRKRGGYSQILIVELYEDEVELGETDTLYLMEYDHHCYVILHLAGCSSCIIADGTNLYLTYTTIKAELDDLLKTSNRGIKFCSQTAMDHCGSSGAMIGLQILKLHRVWEEGKLTAWPDEFEVPIITNKVIKTILNKNESNLIPSTININH